MKSSSRPLAALAMVVLIGAGCGSNAPSETGNEHATNQDAAVKFAECMRDNGVSQFPDPDASGALTIDGVLNGSSIDPNGAAWKRASAACKDLQPSGFTGPGKRSPKQQSAGLEFAQCIREHGVKDFPDPLNGEPLVDTNRIPSAATSDGMTILNAAMQQCRDLGAKAIKGQR
ncbi:hypothetical protein OM076_11590 [Solirubrobacter ginsenosidimutans]|uniref:Secreted protein n=1 Tax=Solirubrobacter ginsenosidimutans TaxID=490573 RepID=A0A9X3MTE8_9ACTN|nr:hypothetical protein [Solirubrobacter ginsenosidimutans]MDA0160910.1 hypothetical protein [Solirubrobacter ginsenosidimutans]